VIKGPLGSLSLRARLTAWYSLALLVVLVVFAVTIVLQQRRLGLRRVDRELDTFIVTVESVFKDELSETADAVAAAAEVNLTVAAPSRSIAILDARGRVVAASSQELTYDEDLAATGHPPVWTASGRSASWRVHMHALATDYGRFLFVAGAPLTDVLREQREAEEAMWVGIPIVLLLAAAGGLWLATVGLRPITDMAQRAHQLAPGGVEDLGQSERRDELGQFARAFNGLVARLRHALVTQRQFMADASHELRTPLSVIQSAADVTLARELRSEFEYRDALSIVSTETRRVGRLVDDMLILARADAGGYPLRPVNLYVDDLVRECCRSLERIAAERRVIICARTPDGLPFHGDETLLRRMIMNLLQNAVTYTREASHVTVEVSRARGHVDIRVQDQGEGIPDADRARIFDRFVQVDAARHGAGAGLGLPIARWIAEAHGGSVELETSGPGGSVFRAVLRSRDVPDAPRRVYSGEGE